MGSRLSASTYAQIVSGCLLFGCPLADLNSHLIMAAAVELFGTEEQKRMYLPRFAAGEIRGGVALTEPDCGTDLKLFERAPSVMA
ncbi:MAG: hypothetical protein CM1200mP41_36150 [Gammaproteobacteria bacterium]|nr:MAG: hypothetical protein CM1200mP41_36150 [Gammaproteobacteria bacterium]